MTSRPREPWAHAAQAVSEHLASDPTRGLTSAEAVRRLAADGPNELEAGERASAALILLRQFANTMIIVLGIAATITLFVGETTDSVVILVIVVLNAVVGFVQEYRAERAMEALGQLTATEAVVVRDGWSTTIPARDLVLGDQVVLAAGDVVPADLRLTEVHDLRVDEAPLTGESEPVTKTDRPLDPDTAETVADRVNMVHKGTAATYGRGQGVVVATGMHTEIGRIAAMLRGQADRTTPLQRKLASLGRRLAGVAIAVCVVVFVAGVVQGEPTDEMFLTAVSLAVAAIPEGLPAVVTVALALGARRMAERRALVRRLPAVETLGSVTVICTDKTGTLTQNRMAVERIWTPGGSWEIEGVGYDPAGAVLPVGDAPHDDRALERVAQVAAACNDAVLHPDDDGTWTMIGDPTEGALLACAGRLGVDVEWRHELYPRRTEIPFDAGRRRMSTVHDGDSDGIWIATKGALDALVPLLHPAHQPVAEQAGEAARRLGADGYRVLALAERHVACRPTSETGTVGIMAATTEAIETDLRLVGIVGIADPPRPEVADAVARCHTAGITPVMITGDHPMTATAIGGRLGIATGAGDEVLTGAELDRLDADDLARRVGAVRIYARTSPEQKLRIVDAWRARGDIVAMTGDGVNDAPALRRADIGVAMGIAGTDVSKEAADMVLADDDFSTIVGAVEEGRRIYDNVRRFVRYLLSTNCGEILIMLTAPLLGMPVPLTAAQILWVNLVTDGLPAVALGLEPAEADTMRRGPRPPTESILGRGLWQHAIWVGALMAVIGVSVQALARAADWPWPTMVFTTVAFLQLGHALAVRSERRSLFALGLRTNRWLAAAIVLSVSLQLATVYVPALHDAFDTEPLTVAQLLVVVVASSGAFVAVELEKRRRRR